MTVFEVIRHNSLFGVFSDNELNQALVVRSLNGADDYANSIKEDVELVTADLMMQLAGIASLKEGDLNIAYNSEQLKQMANSVYEKHGEKERKGYKILDIGVSFE